MNNKPIVFDYLDASQYLQSYYDYRKTLEDGFSYERWASELNFKSRSYLRMVMTRKKRITSTFVSSFCLSAQMSHEESDYFANLVSYSQAKTQSEKNVFGNRLLEIIKSQSKRSILDKNIDFASDPLSPRILVLLSFSDLQIGELAMAKILRVHPEEVLKALAGLEQLGLAKKNVLSAQKTYWTSTHPQFSVPDLLGNGSLKKYHEKSLHEAIAALERPTEERRYLSLLLPLSQEELNEYYMLLENFAATQLTKFNADSFRDRRLYQVNYNIYAVTDKTEVAASSVADNRHSGLL